MMKSLENGIDLGVGLLILVLSISTALYGLVLYKQTPLNHELLDKNTIGVETHLLASDDIDNSTLESIALTLIASAENVDNVRSIVIRVLPAENLNGAEAHVTSVALQTYDQALAILYQAVQLYKDSYPGTEYAQHLAQGKYKTFVTETQSGVTAYILIE